MDVSAETGTSARHADCARRPATLRPGLRRLAVLALLATALPAAAAENRLAQSDDPYLLMHAHDPVDWYPWGPEALEKARREGKPIFLSVGFSACFWCHTMQRESFSDPAIAALLNASFVAITVDREQRPELDALYGLAANVLVGQFGWPNNVFLTPDARPFAAVSYLPPHDDPLGQSGFDTMLATERDLWAQHRDHAVAVADRTVLAMRDAQMGQAASGQVALAPEAWMARAHDLYLSRLDAANGGLGGEGGKSPHAPVLALMLAAQRAHPDAPTEHWLRATLDAMAFGGIDDQLAGGFHRTSTDANWSIPHYEKMLGDNAGLLAVYADAASLLGEPLYREVAIVTGLWMIRELATPDAGFLNSEDARIGDAEGASTLWSREEIAAVLGTPAAARFLDAYAIGSDQPAAPGQPERGVLRLRVPIADTLHRTGQPNAAALLDSLAPERDALLARRRTRPQPRRNTQVVVAENGLAIAALATSAEPLGRPDFLAQASLAARCLWDAAWDERDGLLHHELIDGRARGDGTLDDHALLAEGLLALSHVTGDPLWHARAAHMADAMLHRFAQPDGGLLASAARDLILPPRDTADDAQPSGTAAAIAVLLRLDAPGDAAAAFRAASWIGGAVAARPDAWPAAILAMVQGATLLRQSNSRREDVPQTATLASPGAIPGAAFAMPDTALHVHADATLREYNGARELAVTLRVDPGYHVNANPASSADLVATTLHVAGLDAAAIRYPAAATLHPGFTPATLDVYEGAAQITAALPAASDAQPVFGSVDVQACTMTLCLPPATLAFTTGR
jgi:uncharacterized protein YyaL (SSP411 family)